MRLLCPLLLAAVGVANDAQPQVTDRSTPAAYFASSDDLPAAERPSRDQWPDYDDYSAFLDDADLERWATQARSGRAQAAINAGDHLLIRATLAPGNCAEAIRWYRRAEDLGSEFAAGRLGAAYSEDECPERDLATAIEWWRKAVDLGNFDAARVLSRRLSEPGSPHYDPILALAYTEVAAENPEPWRDADPPPADPVVLAAALTPTQIDDARRIADASRAAIRARTGSYSASPPEETLLRRELPQSTVRILAIDDLRECERNLRGNCRGVRRLAYADVSNATDDYLRCSFEVRTSDGGDNTSTTLERETLVAPRVARFLRLGRIAGTPSPGAMRVACTPLRGFAAAVSSGVCSAQPAEAFDIESAYPKAALRAGIEGRVRLYVVTDAREGPPLFVEVMQTSRSALLDTAALDSARRIRYRSDCDAGYRVLEINFRIAA